MLYKSGGYYQTPQTFTRGSSPGSSPAALPLEAVRLRMCRSDLDGERSVNKALLAVISPKQVLRLASAESSMLTPG